MLAYQTSGCPHQRKLQTQVLDRDSGKYSFTVSSYMLELYQDELTDLLLPVPAKQGIQKVHHHF